VSNCRTVQLQLAATGPNTGGKTASLKAFGLAALMAKAGLFLPVAAGQAPPRLLWFDKVRNSRQCNLRVGAGTPM
jgi:dsDNA-specific endonuclease/ATPase MutS2